MGVTPDDPNGVTHELPRYPVTIDKPFAVSEYDATFEEWDACVKVGPCPKASDSGYGRGRQPAINVSWDDAQLYVAWLSKMTGKTYRLLSEAEWEYAARAGTQTIYYWGDEIGKNNAACDGRGSRDRKVPAPAGSFKPNAFGLYDMAGNVLQWVEDCYHDNYDDAPGDGSVWRGGDCNYRVARGGSWLSDPRDLGAAHRARVNADNGNFALGFRVGRTLTP